MGGATVDVRASDPLVSSGLSPEEVQAVIKKNFAQIRHCYNKLLQSNPGASGTVKTLIVIGVDGRVASASATKDSTITAASMRACVIKQIQRLKFPKPRGGQTVEVKYPFNFDPL